MFCKFCGAKLADSDAFCASCGTPVQRPEPPVEEAPVMEVPVEKTPMEETPAMDSPMMESPETEAVTEDAPVTEASRQEAPAEQLPAEEAPAAAVPYCFACGAKLQADDPCCLVCGAAIPPAPPAAKKKVKSKLWGLLIPVAVVGTAMLVVLLGLLTDWFGLCTPLDKLERALRKTNESTAFSADIQFSFHAATDSMELESTEGAIRFQTIFDAKTREFSLLGELVSEYDTLTIGVLDEKAISKGAFPGEEPFYNIEDISEPLDSFFDSLEDRDPMRHFNSENEIMEQLEEELDAAIDAAQLRQALAQLEKKFSDEAWLKENMGYRTEKAKDGTHYVFQFDLVPSLDLLWKDLEPIFDKDTARSFHQVIKMLPVMLEKQSCTLTFVVDDGYCTDFMLHLELAVNQMDESMSVAIDLSASLDDFNDRDAMPMEELIALAQEAEKAQ